MKKPASLEVAPPPKPFERDPVPHPEAKDIFGAIEQSREWRKQRREKAVQRSAPRWSSKAPPSEQKQDIPASLRLSVDGPNRRPRPPPRVKEPPIDNEFDMSTRRVPTSQLPAEFTSPPLAEGLLSSVKDKLGPDARPTPIQALSLKHLFSPPKGDAKWRQYLLASETGSGKSLAYMLPLLQDLKASEVADGESISHTTSSKEKLTPYNPRAIILAPTHELARQLSTTAKSVLHNIKLRVLCASQPNKSAKVTSTNASAAKLATRLANLADEHDMVVRALV